MSERGRARPLAGARRNIMAGWPYAAGPPTPSQTRGHVICDVLARFARARGADVRFTLGCDGFGLPVHAAARASGTPLPDFVAAARQRHAERAALLGISADPGPATSDPEVYARTQEMFLLALEHGIAVRRPAPVNECPGCAAVRANREAAGGRCGVCGTPVVAAVREQWFFRMDPLAADIARAADDPRWPAASARALRAWYAARRGTLVPLALPGGGTVDAFLAEGTSLARAALVAVPPDHPRLAELAALGDPSAPARYLGRTTAVPPVARPRAGPADGEPLGLVAVAPGTGAELPVYVGRVTAGGGGSALLVTPADDPAHARFAVARGLTSWPEGTGGAPAPGRPAVVHGVEDWLVSRQRAWGAPVPVVHCAGCGIVPVPRADLPVRLPTPVPADGGLDAAPEFHRTACPRCGAAARRDTDVIDCNADLWWHYLLPGPDAAHDRPPVDIACYDKAYAALTPYYLAGVALLRFAGRTRAPYAFGSLLLHGGVTGDGDLAVLVGAYGADAVRLWLAGSVRPDRPLRWSPETVRRLTRTVRRAAAALAAPPGEVAEPWAARAAATRAEVGSHYDELRPHLAAQAATALLDAATRAGDAPGARHAARTAAGLLAPFCPSLERELVGEAA